MVPGKRPRFVALATLLLLFASAAGADVPSLPAADGEVLLAAQEWPRVPGPRTIAVQVCYPGSRLDQVTTRTGLMLTLHNWGGTRAIGTADPRMLADRYDVIAISLDYLQSGPYDPAAAPYDFGYLQALDALRALHFVYESLQSDEQPFDAGRIYATGGSGGGNVSLMCNKLAPRTFAGIIELSGMTRLSDDMAFNLPGGSTLNAGYSRDPSAENYLSPDEQAIRFVGHPAHAAIMHKLGAAAKVLVVHGEHDRSCPVADAREMVVNLQAAGLDVEPHFITQADVDGQIFLDDKHRLGDRGRIVQHVADRYLLPDSPEVLRRRGATDFQRRDSLVRYATEHGEFVISYEQGYPIGQFLKSEGSD